MKPPLSSAIYFDSYLPNQKRHVRLQRLVKSSRDLINYHSAWLAGVPKRDRHGRGTADVELFPLSWPSQAKAPPPPPPFFVPAIIDALKHSSNYQSLVKLVPGEADGFCAQHVRHSAGLVLTSDSDLLVHDLGQDGGIVFFSDIEADMAGKKLTGLQYRPADLCRRLSIRTDNGLCYLAFEISKDPYLTLGQAIQRSKDETVAVSQREYTDFMEQYLVPEVGLDLEADQPLILDPRVSELTLRSLRTCAAGGDPELEMYLPFLLDCPSRASAWEASKPVRQLAYAILQFIRGSGIQSVSEMRRLQTESSGVRVDVPARPDVDAVAASFLSLLSRIEAGLSGSENTWVVLSIYQDIAMTAERGRSHPVSLCILDQDARGRLDVCSWDFIHLLAQTQATYYSIRMLRQILEFAAHYYVAVSQTLLELASVLSRIPELSGFPSAGDFADTLCLVREGRGIACLLSICAEFEDFLPHIQSIQHPQETKTTKKRKAISSTGWGRYHARSSNRFDSLSGRHE